MMTVPQRSIACAFGDGPNFVAGFLFLFRGRARAAFREFRNYQTVSSGSFLTFSGVRQIFESC